MAVANPRKARIAKEKRMVGRMAKTLTIVILRPADNFGRGER